MNCYQLLYKNIKRHRKYYEQLENMINNPQRMRGNTQFSNVVNTGLMDTVITKNIIENEKSDLIDRNTYVSGEITKCEVQDMGMSSILDVSVFSQFKSLSKALTKEENLSPIKKKNEKVLIPKFALIDKLTDPKTNTIVKNRLNNLKSVENIVNSIKAKYNKLKRMDSKDTKSRKPEDITPIIKPKEKPVFGSKNINFANFKNAVIKNLKETSNLCTTDKDSVNNTLKRDNSTKNINTPCTLRKQSNKDSIVSNNSEKSVYNINFNLNLNLNLNKKPKVLNNLELSKNPLTDRNNSSDNKYYKGSINNIKNLYYQQFPKPGRLETIDSNSRSKSQDRSSRNTSARGLIYNSSNKSRDMFSLKKVSKRDNSARNSINSYNSVTSTTARKYKDVKPQSINLNTLRLDKKSLSNSKMDTSRSKNKVFK
jgi:hypothetical protein